PPRIFILHCSLPLPVLPSFPTRRSSDLPLTVTPPFLLTNSTPAFAACRNESPKEASAPPCSASMPISIVLPLAGPDEPPDAAPLDRKSTRLNSSHRTISYAVFCLKKKNN